MVVESNYRRIEKMKYKAINKKDGHIFYFNEQDMCDPVIKKEWQEDPIWVIDDPEEPDSLNKIMLLKRDYELFYRVIGEWRNF